MFEGRAALCGVVVRTGVVDAHPLLPDSSATYPGLVVGCRILDNLPIGLVRMREDQGNLVKTYERGYPVGFLDVSDASRGVAPCCPPPRGREDRANSEGRVMGVAQCHAVPWTRGVKRGVVQSVQFLLACQDSNEPVSQ